MNLNLNFTNEYGEAKLFRFSSLRNSTPDNQIQFIFKHQDILTAEIEFKPTINGRFSIDKINPEDFLIHLYDNPYLNAESNVFPVYEHTKKDEKIGWIFPINYLDSDQYDNLSDSTNIDLYKFAAYSKLLTYKGAEIKQPLLQDSKRYNILDFYDENLIILILHKNTIDKVINFKIENYDISLAKIGYCRFNVSKAIFNSNKNALLYEAKKLKKLILKKSNFNIDENPFVKSVFYQYLNHTENCYLRFVFIYQIIELLMDQARDEVFIKNLNLYQSNILNKNDFRENIGESLKERNSIKQVFSNSIRNLNEHIDFIQKCNGFLIKNGSKEAETLSSAVYNLRNLLVHNFRFVAENLDELDELVTYLEFIIIEILMNYNFTVFNSLSYDI
jgi:hypothetical protein